MATANLTSATLATLRASQLKEAAGTLDRVAGEFSALSQLADVSDPGGEIALTAVITPRYSVTPRS